MSCPGLVAGAVLRDIVRGRQFEVNSQFFTTPTWYHVTIVCMNTKSNDKCIMRYCILIVIVTLNCHGHILEVVDIWVFWCLL